MLLLLMLGMLDHVGRQSGLLGEPIDRVENLLVLVDGGLVRGKLPAPPVI